MTTMERLVRPFQLRSVTPPTRIASDTTTQDAANAVLSIGANGSAKTGSETYNTTASYFMEAVHREHAQSPSRKVHTKRITSPDDPSQYIDVEVIDEIRFRGPNGEIWILRLNNSESAVTG